MAMAAILGVISAYLVGFLCLQFALENLIPLFVHHVVSIPWYLVAILACFVTPKHSVALAVVAAILGYVIHDLPWGSPWGIVFSVQQVRAWMLIIAMTVAGYFPFIKPVLHSLLSWCGIAHGETPWW